MRKRILALCALAGSFACLHAAEVPAAPLAIYYSFDSTPPPVLFTEVQSELNRILAPTGMNIVWRALDHRSDTEAFREIVVLHFRGACYFEPAPADHSAPAMQASITLAETDLVDGHILPFGDVQCDQLRHFLSPVASSLKEDAGNAALGRAIARVSAHELYHMLTGSMTHARSGIARAEHSRAELTASSFTFARPEETWLRSWVERRMAPEKTSRDSVSVATLESDTPDTAGATSAFAASDSR